MDLPSTNWVRKQSDSMDPQVSSPAVQSADGATFERQLTEIANSDGGGGAMPAASTLQPAPSTGIVRGGVARPLYSEDASLILGLEEALIKGGAAQGTARNNVYSLLGFGRWLFANNKPAIVARLNDKSLIADARQFIEEGHPRAVLTAIDHLRTSQSTGGSAPVKGRAELNPHSEDVALIDKYRNEAATGTAGSNAVALRSFSDYLRQNNKKGIAARLYDTSLDGDVDAYKSHPGYNRKILAALAHLRQSPGGTKAMEQHKRHVSPVPVPGNTALMELKQVGDAAAYHRASQEAGGWPEKLFPAEGYDQDLPLGLMDEPGPSSAILQPPQSTGISRRRREQPLYSEDASAISRLEKALTNSGAAKSTANCYVATLRTFGRWLFANNKPAIVARLNDESVTDDARQFIEEGRPRAVLAAIDHLRTSQSTGRVVPIAGPAELNPHSEDVALIDKYRNEAATSTAKSNATALRSFSDYLRQNNKKGIAARLSGTSLNGDVDAYKSQPGYNRKIGAALAHLRQSPAGAEAMELERHIDPEDAALRES
ncbi:hypothetical protein XI09_09500, partial [Bradyrhizobium sp. CCBAU 11386]|nr:hypothetical protein [Bradyrhizobium sp. CCBAU 11386]